MPDQTDGVQHQLRMLEKSILKQIISFEKRCDVTVGRLDLFRLYGADRSSAARVNAKLN